ncbi:hypothetical protein GAU_2253 [Gemmatimonas aurantiaca T-27]|uniref:Peptidase S49 domain-containing protein n=2 Tax=Gemmatimonas aurantiaca TaxID=173480 RepID=C1AAN9_GEMAT|nr:S49 family peptidase [Gemmatimonas aurantiaca]BAH39295.1 hypothetical protein GAU_2253 [Gemmatimonas aurantiaca T-27]
MPRDEAQRSASAPRSPRAARFPDTIRNAVLSTPWAISEAGLQRLLAVVSRIEPTALEQLAGTPLPNTRLVTMRDGIASIPVTGVLTRRASWFDAVCGAVDYTTLALELRSALDDHRVEAVVLQFDSPGGEVSGCSELGEQIRAARERKPVYAYVGGDCCSAAYWLAAQCTEIHVNNTALTGNLGVRMTAHDVSRRLKREGIDVITIVSSTTPAKPHDPTTDEAKARCQKIVDDLAAVFHAQVALGRSVEESQIYEQYGRGAVFVGVDAVSHGLADAVTTYEALLASLTAADRSDSLEVTMPVAKKTAPKAKPKAAAKRFTTAAPKSTPASTTADEEKDEDDEDLNAAEDGAGDTDDEEKDEELDAADDGAEEDDDEDKKKPESTKAKAHAAGVKAENARVMAIVGAYGERFGIEALQPLLADPSCTKEQAAMQLLEGGDRRRMTRLKALRGDDASLQNAPKVSGNAAPAGMKAGAGRLLSTYAKVNPQSVPAALRGSTSATR